MECPTVLQGDLLWPESLLHPLNLSPYRNSPQPYEGRDPWGNWDQSCRFKVTITKYNPTTDTSILGPTSSQQPIKSRREKIQRKNSEKKRPSLLLLPVITIHPCWIARLTPRLSLPFAKRQPNPHPGQLRQEASLRCKKNKQAKSFASRTLPFPSIWTQPDMPKCMMKSTRNL